MIRHVVTCYASLVLKSAVAGAFPPGILRCFSVLAQVRDVCKAFILSEDQLRCLMDKLADQINLGLNAATKEQSSVKCWTTYVQDLPTGRERGTFFALDLGGTMFRVLLIRLNGSSYDMKSKTFSVAPEIMNGTGEQLFDHIAECLSSFAKEHRVTEPLSLGFTFSFPLEQVGLQTGILQRWTKGFNCSGVVGEDIVTLLAQAIKRRNDIQIDITAILNDTTGTLMSCAWKNHNCRLGVILGTGSNACYVEKIKNVIGFDGDTSKPEVLINTEWGAFGDNGELNFISTKYDKEVDARSINKGFQIFEKMISGMYLGELVRLILVKLVDDNVLFGGIGSPELCEHDSFKTAYISEIETDKKGIFTRCRKILKELKIQDASDQDCANVRFVCEVVSRRAAHLASAGIATILNKMSEPSVTIGVDGSLYRYHPHMHDLMFEKISALVDHSIKHITLMLSVDGSGRGAALVAAAAVSSKSC